MGSRRAFVSSAARTQHLHYRLPNDIWYYAAVNGLDASGTEKWLLRKHNRSDRSKAQGEPSPPHALLVRTEVAQTKKAKVKKAILHAAYRLFSERGYSSTNISAIAKAANVSPANVYVYFNSKLDILFSIYPPWLTKHFDELERSLERISEPSQRLKKILSVLWRDIPAADNGFANNMMQAFSTTTVSEGYSPALRIAVEKRLARLLEQNLPKLGRTASRDLANVFLMAFDGYILNFHLNEKTTCPMRRIDVVVQLVLAASQIPLAPDAPVRGATDEAAALASGASR